MSDAYVGVTSAGAAGDRWIDNELVTTGVGTVYRQRVRVFDQFTGSEFLADQTGAGAVMTFTFSASVDMVFIRPTGANGRASFGTNPTVSTGIPLFDGETAQLPMSTTSVKVFAASGTFAVWGFRY